MSRVFVSHSSRDHGLAEDVREWLSAAGHQVFLDQDPRDGIAAGEEWERRLHEELRRADAVVCIVTAAYVRSRWCTAEVAVARSRGCRVLPIAAEPGVRHELLASVQHVELAAARHVLPDALQRAGVVGWPDRQSPYPGLAAFEADMRAVFFGRERDLDRLLKRIRAAARGAERSVLLVVGPSGCGKSSLVRAGLVPAVTEEPDWWRLAPMEPRADPVAALEGELLAAAVEARLGWELADVRRRLGEAGLAGVAQELLPAAPGGRARRLLIVIDQFEQMLSDAPAAERARFAALVTPALSGPVQVVGTVRPEFLDPLLADAELSALPTTLFSLRPLHREALRTVIRKPAELAGISITDDLADDLVKDTGTGEALPLLAFALAQLAEGIGRGGALTRQRYVDLGGVQGALAKQAEGAVPAGRRAEVIAGLLDLAAVDESGRVVRRRVRRDDLPDLDSFVECRLLTTDAPGAPADPTVWVEVAHEAFLTAWPPLAAEIEAQATALRARRAVDLAAERWQADGRAPERLWERRQLGAAVNDLRFETGSRVTLGPTSTAFLRASVRRDRVRRTRAFSILSALLAVAVVAAVIAAVQQRSAQRSQRLAVSRQLVAQADAVRASDPRTGLMLGVAAERIQPGAHNRASLAAGLLSTRYAGTLTGHSAELRSTAARPDGKVLATVGLDGRVILWDLTAPGPPKAMARPLTGGNLTEPAAFSPDGRVLAVGGGKGSLLLYDVSDPTAPRRLPGSAAAAADTIALIAFAPDGHTMALAGRDPATVTLWDLTDPARPVALGKPLRLGDFSYLTAFDRTGRWLVTGSSDAKQQNTVRVWDLANRSAPVPGTTLKYDRAVAFHPATGLLAVDSSQPFSTAAFLWDLSDPGHPRQVTEVSGPGSGSVAGFAFSADGRDLAVVSSYNTAGSVRIYDLTDRHDPRPIEEPPGARSYGASEENYIREDRLHDVTFLPGRPAVAVVAGDDNVLTLWDYTDPARPRRTGQPVNSATGLAKTVVVLPDGRRALTGHADGTIGVWDLTDGGAPHSAGPSIPGPGSISALTFRDARTLLVGRRDGSVTSWDVAGAGRPTGTLLPPGEGTDRQVSFGSHGAVIAVTRPGPAVLVGSRTLNPDRIEVVDPATTGQHAEITQPLFPGRGGTGAIGGLVFSPSGRMLAVPATSWGTYVSLWKLDDRGRAQRIGDHLEPRDLYDAVAFSPDGRTLAYTQGFGLPPAVVLVDLHDPAAPHVPAAPLTGHTEALRALAFSPDGRLLASGSDDRSVILWNVADAAHPVRLGRPLAGATDAITHVAFTPDGRILLAAGDKGELYLWDVEDAAEPVPLGLPIIAGGRDINAVAVSPDGRTVAAGDPDGTVALWDLAGLEDLLDRPAALACARTGGGLSSVEWQRYIDGLPYRETC